MATRSSGLLIGWKWVLSKTDRSIALSIALLLSAMPILPLCAQSSGSSTQTPASTIQDIRQLELGKPIARDMAAGETHYYQVKVQAGQYVRLVVQQKGIDVLVKLFGLDGKQLAASDNPNGTQGPEALSAIAQATGDYRIEVVFGKKSAPDGLYEASISDLRTATEQDKNRVAAQQTFIEGQLLRRQGTGESRQAAIEKFSEALRLFQSVADTWGEANTLYYLGYTFNNLSENQKALTYYDRALPLYQSLGNRWGETYILNNVGGIYWALGDRQKALEYYDRALPLRRELGDRAGEIATLNNIGLAYWSLGEQQKALSNYLQALPLAQALGDPSSSAYTLTNIGLVYWSLGEEQKALEYYNQALPLVQKLDDGQSMANTLNSIGAVYKDLDEYQKALEYYNQALALSHKAGDRASEATMLNNIGKVYSLLDDKQKALEYYERALELRHQVGERAGEGITSANIGDIYAQLGQKEKALQYYDRALPLARAVGNRTTEASALHGIAVVERDKGDFKKALSYIEDTIEIVEDLRTKVASQELRSSYFASVQNYYEFYIDLLMQLDKQFPSQGYDAKALQVSERARARSLLDILTEAKADIRQGADPQLLEKERILQQQLNDKESRRMQLLNTKNSETQVAELQKEIDALLTQYQEVKALIRTKSPRYAALTQPQPLSLSEIQQQVLDDNTLLLEYSLGKQRSYLWAVTKTGITSYELPPRREIQAAAKQFRELVTDPLLSQDSVEVAKQAAQLSQLVLAPVAAQLGQKRLIIVADGALQYVPFAAITKPKISTNENRSIKEFSTQNFSEYVPLIAQHEIVNLPSASSLAILRRELKGRAKAPKMVAMLADPVFDSNDERIAGEKQQTGTQTEEQRSAGIIGANWLRLPFTRTEAEAIEALVPPAERQQAFGFDADRAAATSPNLADFRIVHFATHGILNPSRPQLSGLVLSLVDKNGTPQDGFLRLHDIFNLKLSADLVVLSACKTGAGKIIRGEGLVGLTRGFMYAGAERVVASLWSVNDPATAELMSTFYRGMLKENLSPTAALRKAQIEMYKQEKWRSPYYWAAFSLQGEWR